MNEHDERIEALMRIPIGLVSGIILGVWKLLVMVFFIFNFIAVLVNGKRVRDPAELSEMWNTQNYTFIRYLTFNSNVRPFPFEKLAKNMSAFDSK